MLRSLREQPGYSQSRPVEPEAAIILAYKECCIGKFGVLFWSMALRFVPAALLTGALLSGGGCSTGYHIAWGDVHGHTALSDGKGSLDDYFTYARDRAKLDFVIVTDHDFGNGPPWRMPTNVWHLTQAKADEYTVNGRFIAIAGYEWTSQGKYWTDTGTNVSEHLFPGPPKHYNHKNVYFPGTVDYLFSAKDPAFNTPDSLASAVRKYGGLIHNNHPDAGLEGAGQFDYSPENSNVIVNTEMLADVMWWQGKRYDLKGEQTIGAFLNGGGRTGFVGGSDTHEGKPSARTAVLVPTLKRTTILEALRQRHNYAVSRDRILLDFRINGHMMGSELELDRPPRIRVEIRGTDKIQEVVIIRNGKVLHEVHPERRQVRLDYLDTSFEERNYYYVRVSQANKDEYGNPARAWSSPIWVSRTAKTIESIGWLPRNCGI